MNDRQQRLPASPEGEGPSLKLWLWFLVAMLLAFHWSALSQQQEEPRS